MSRKIAKNGPLPKGWREVKIIDFSPLQRGFDLPAAQIKEGTYPVVYSNGIKNYHSEYKAKAPGVVTGRSGTIGEVTYVTQDYWPHNTSLWVTDFKGNHPRFVFYFLQNLRLDRFYAGSGVPSLNRNDVHKKSVLIPTFPEQKAIASLLEKWDTAIEETEALIEAKEKRFKWLAKRLISKAEHSKYGRVSLITKEVSNRNRDGAVERILSVTNHSGFVLPEEQFEHRVASADLSNYKIVSNGQYAYNPSRINVGSIARLDDWDTGVLSPMYVVFRLKEKKVNSDYFLHWLSLEETRQRIKNSAQGSVRETVSFGNFGAISIPLPSLGVQTHIAKTLNVAKGEIDLLKQLAEQYRTQKRGLMQKLLTGEWRVKEEKMSCRT